jgi:hypothetical protein
MYSHQKPCLIVFLFQENKSFGASTICIHPLMYVKSCREHYGYSVGGGTMILKETPISFYHRIPFREIPLYSVQFR